jgi:hypothetical protein
MPFGAAAPASWQAVHRGVRCDGAPLKDRDHLVASYRALAPAAGTPDTEQVRIPTHVLPIRTEARGQLMHLETHFALHHARAAELRAEADACHLAAAARHHRGLRARLGRALVEAGLRLTAAPDRAFSDIEQLT